MTPKEQMSEAKAPGTNEKRRKGHPLVWLLAGVVFLIAALLFTALGLTGRPVAAPEWVVTRVEARINRALADQATVELGGAEVLVDKGWVPRVRLRKVALLNPGGQTIATLPELRIAFAPQPLLRGKLRPRSLRLRGASLTLNRSEDGRFDLALGAGVLQDRPPGSLAEVLDRIDGVFNLPFMAALTRVEAEALTLTLDDARAARVWQISDGRLTLVQSPENISISLAFDLAGDDGEPASAELGFVTRRGTSAASIGVTVKNVPSSEIALQAPALTWLSVLEAPISGSFRAEIDTEGQVGTLDGTLGVTGGALRPSEETRPLPIDSGKFYFSYDPRAEKIIFSDVSIESRVLRLRASGQAYLRDMVGGLPKTLVSQVNFSEVTFDPEGLFEEPVRFSQGALDLRLRLDPFEVNIGQLSLIEEGRRLEARGDIGALGEGYRVALDFALDAITHDRLLAIWPVEIVPRTRAWIAANVQAGLLFDVKAALRLAPGQEPRLSLGYEFSDADVRFLKTLPPVLQGKGFASVEGTSYTLYIESGHVTPAKGGNIDVTGTVFRVPDITQRPANGVVSLRTESTITAALSLLDEKPFEFLTKAGRPVDLAEGRARMQAEIRLPLVKKVPLSDVDYKVTGQLFDVRSDKLVPGRALLAKTLELNADRGGLRISGAGTLGALPFNAVWSQAFGPDGRGKSRVEGSVELSQKFVEEFRIGLPKDAISGSGTGQIRLDLVKGGTGQFRLVSDLNRVGIRIAEIGWSKPRNATGMLEVSGRLGTPPAIDKLSLTAPGLSAEGEIALRAGGGLELARFSRVRVGQWLDGAVDLRGQGRGKPVIASVTGGTIDVRQTSFGGGKGGGSGAPITLNLDRLIISEGITLTGFQGEFRTRGGFQGDFTGRVNGGARVRGAVSPKDGRSAIRIRAEDAGAVFASAGVFEKASGGAMDLVLLPRKEAGQYDGTLAISTIRIKGTPVLAELLNVISVVGLLDQLNGSGLVFSNVDAEFRLTPAAIEITRGSAVGPSMGVSMAGIYGLASKRFDMSGVVSPVYLVNGIGSIFTRRGEGLFGFNYSVQGTSAAPQVQVNPLSIFTPGMFREIFRRPPPTLSE